MYKHALSALAGATVLLVGASTALASAAPPTPFVSKNPVLTVITNTGTPAGTPGGLECTTGKWAKAGNRTYTIRVVRDSSTVVATFTGVAKGGKVAYDIKEGDAALAAAGLDDGSDRGRTLKCIVSPTGHPNQRGFTKTVVVQPGGNAGTGGGTTTPPELGAPVKTTGTAVTVTGLAGETTGAQTSWELRCNEGTWDPAAPSGDAAKNSWSYRWTRNGSPVLDGAGTQVTTRQLQLSAADAGADIGCLVVQTRNGYASGAVQSSNTMKVAGSQPPAGGGGGSSTVGAPSLTGANPSITENGATATVVGAGDDLVCLTGGWSAPDGYTLMPVNFSFRWVLNSTEVLHNPLSEESFDVPADLDAGDKITCLVTARSQSSNGTIVESSPVTTNPVEFQ
ncbi:MAG: hypothetical protein JWN84_2770 [Nocardioides sp.]|nr:hypothetical protein [Nocardioides sp.]